jgi:hypothetical protein
MRNRIQSQFQISLACALAVTLLAFSANATVPGQVNYQGLLLDDVGDPITGPVDMVFALYPDLSGGSALWTEAHDGVDVLDGVYEVELGSTTALTPDLLAGAAVYLEIEVETEILTPRQRLLAVPYALQAESSNSTGTLTAVAASQIYENFAFDGGAPANDDPSEGTSDVDGDGLANFVDSDNDGDGLSDTAELAQGTDINLITPTITGIDPPSLRHCTTGSVHVQGTGFDSGFGVAFGSQSPVPLNPTTTDFDVAVGPQTPGLVDITVTNPNFEADTAIDSFDFFSVTPTITSFDPVIADAGTLVSLQVHGANFEPGISVTVGSENPTPTNVTSTSFEISVLLPEAELVDVTVTNFCGEQATANYNFGAFQRAFVSSVAYDSNLGGIAGADAKCAQLASDAGLPGTFLAWLSDGVTDPDSRFAKSPNPYYATVLNLIIADNWTDLTDGIIDQSIIYSENGGVISDTVFTNVKTDGTKKDNTNHCNGWRGGGTDANLGRSIEIDEDWTDYQTAACGTSQRIYCFQQ